MKKFDFGLQNPIYHSNSTLNSAQDRKNHRMFLVTMFNKFQNETQIIFTKNFEIDLKGYISKIFDVYVISPHITQITLKYVTKLWKRFILVDKILF